MADGTSLGVTSDTSRGTAPAPAPCLRRWARRRLGTLATTLARPRIRRRGRGSVVIYREEERFHCTVYGADYYQGQFTAIHRLLQRANRLNPPPEQQVLDRPRSLPCPPQFAGDAMRFAVLGRWGLFESLMALALVVISESPIGRRAEPVVGLFPESMLGITRGLTCGLRYDGHWNKQYGQTKTNWT